MSVLITKMNGEQEPFNSNKLDRSLRRAGASEDARKEIITHIEEELKEGDTTQEIYEHAFEQLRDIEQSGVAARYSVKRAVLDLGPSGFPFEQFVAEILKTMGYEDVKTGMALQGGCAPHEVDVVAVHGDKNAKIAVEVKFHNSLGIKTDLKTALYVRERFRDLERGGMDLSEGWLITNTRFTRNAVRYGNCSGLEMLGWDYPQNRGLEVLIDEAAVHPLTALTTIGKNEKRAFLDENIVLCRQIPLDDDALTSHGVTGDTQAALRNEIDKLCGTRTAE